MSFFEELSTTVKATLYERVSSPLLGTFLFAWVVFNWKAILLLTFSDSSMFSRLIVIEANYVNLWDNLYWPLIYASIFTLIYPVVSVVPFLIWEFFASIKVKARRRITSTETLTIAQSIAMKNENRDLEKKYAEAMGENSKKVTQLEEELKLAQDRAFEKNEKFLLLNDSYNTLKEKNNELEELFDDGFIKLDEQDIEDICDLMIASSKLIDSESFTIQAVFPASVWKMIGDKNRQAIDEMFATRVSAGEAYGVVIARDVEGTQKIYSKSTSKPETDPVLARSNSTSDAEKLKDHLLVALGDTSGFFETRESIYKILGLHQLRADKLISELLEEGMIDAERHPALGLGYSLTGEGKQYLFDNGLI